MIETKMISHYAEDAPGQVPFTGGRLGNEAFYNYHSMHVRARPEAPHAGVIDVVMSSKKGENVEPYSSATYGAARFDCGDAACDATARGGSGSGGAFPGWDDDLPPLASERGSGVETGAASFAERVYQRQTTHNAQRPHKHPTARAASDTSGDQESTTSTIAENCSCRQCLGDNCLMRDPLSGEFFCMACSQAALDHRRRAPDRR